MEFTVGGIIYKRLEGLTLRQEDAIMRAIRAVGTELFEAKPGETAEDYSLRLLSDIIAEGHAARILGVIFVPDGKKWTRELAAETAEKFDSTTDPADKAALREAMIPIMADFFASGLFSVATSRRFSEAFKGIVGQPNQTVDPSTSANGPTWLGTWLAGIRLALKRWRTGRFARRSWPTSRR